MAITRLLKLTAVALAVLACGSVLAMTLRTPSHDRDWKPEYARLPVAAIDGDLVTIGGLRDFRYGPAGAPTERRYLDTSYRLSEIDSLWYGISHFAAFGLAHTFVSFGFTDGRFLVLSIEARQTVGQSYSPLRGLFGAYELIVVAGTERDIIGLRTHHRKERVYLYRVEAPKASIERVFDALIGRMNEVHAAAEFYHTISDNCTVSLWRYVEQLSTFGLYTNPKLLLPGFSDEVALDLGLISGNGTIETIRRAALIEPTRTDLDDPQFSAKIRRQ